MPHRKKSNQSGKKGGSIIDQPIDPPSSGKGKKAKVQHKGKNK